LASVSSANHLAARRQFALATQDDGASGRFAIAPVLTVWWLAIAFLRFGAGMFVTSPSIFGDELTYWSLARSFHHGLHFVAFNQHYDIPTQLYPILLSPLFAAQDSIVIYPLVKLVSSLMFCSVVFPAYFMARELLTQEESIVVAMLSLLIPGGAYTATVMAENLYYPVFILAAWLLYRALYHGRLRDSVLAGLAFAVAYYVKPHVLFMLAAYGFSLLAWLAARILEAPSVKLGTREVFPGLLCRCIPFAIFVCGLGIRFLETAAYNHSLTVVIFGEAYAGVLQLSKHSVPLMAFLASGVWLLVAMTISTAWLPVLAMIGSATLWKRLSDAQRWFWVFSSFTALMFLVMITRHNVLNDDALRTHERYVFQLSPLFFTWYLVCRRLLSWRWLLSLAAATVAAVSVAVARSSNLLSWMDFADSPTLSGMWVFHLRYPHHAAAVIFAFLFAGELLCLATALATRKPRSLLIGWAVFLIACNAGWYDLQITYIKREVKRCNDVAMYLKAVVPVTKSIGLLQDGTDVRYGWYSNFWLSQPLYYFRWKERGDWFEEPVTASSDGALDFKDHRPQLLLASDSIALPYAVFHEFPVLHLRIYHVPALTETKSSQ
jgi:hypothetical protein